MKWNILITLLITLPLISGCTEAQLPTLTQTFETTLTITIEPTATITPTPEPEYELCPDIENFRDCELTEEELLSGDYWNWLNKVVAPTLLEEFKAREDKIVDDIPLNGIGISSGSAFYYLDNGVLENEEVTAPWERLDVTFATTSVLDPITNSTLEYMILPVFCYDKETQTVYPVVTVQPLFHPERLEETMDIYLNEMNMPVIVYSSSTGSFEKDNITMDDTTCPLVTKVYDRLGQDEVWDRTERFYNGDVSAFSSPDMIVRFNIISAEPFR